MSLPPPAFGLAKWSVMLVGVCSMMVTPGSSSVTGRGTVFVDESDMANSQNITPLAQRGKPVNELGADETWLMR
jgi:hypothetical protein